MKNMSTSLSKRFKLYILFFLFPFFFLHIYISCEIKKNIYIFDSSFASIFYSYVPEYLYCGTYK